VLGNRDGGGGEELSLPRLGGVVVDLEDPHADEGIAVGEGVQTRSEEDVLLDTRGHGPRERILRVAAARYHEGPHVLVIELPVGITREQQLRPLLLGEDAHGEGVLEDELRR